MATYSAQCSAVGGFSYANYFKLYVELTETEVSIANNTSKVQYNVYCRSSSSGSISANHYLYFNINGSDKRNETIKVNVSSPYANIPIASGTTEAITHNNDGTKSISFSAQIKASSYGVSASTSGTFTLSTIARASSVAGGSGNIGGTSTITVTRASSSFTHTLRYSFGSLSGNIATGVGTSHTWTIPTSFYAQVPNAKSKTGTIYCDTYNGSTLVGTKSITFTATVTEASSRPTVSATLTDTNATTKALTGNASKMVKGKSTGQLVVTSSVKNSATIKSITINGTNVGTAASITKSYANISTSSFTIVVTDSRGFTNTSYVLTPSYVNYVPLTLNTTIFRPQPTGTEVQMTYSGNYFNASFGSVANTLSITWKYKVKGASSWTNGGTITPKLSGNTISSKTISLGTGYNYQTAYEFQITAVDKLTNSVQTMSLSVGLPVFDWGKEFLRVNQKLLLKDAPANFGGCKDITVEGAYVRLFTVDLTAMYKTASIWFALTDTQTADENLLCNLYVHNGNNSTVVHSFKYLSTLAGFDTSRLVAVVTGNTRTDVYLKMWDTDSPAITILSMTKMYEDNNTYGKITIDCNTTITSLPSGNKYNPTGLTIATSILSKRGHINWVDQTDGNGHLIAKSALAHWNGSYNSRNDSNLFYCAEGPIQAKPTTLYNNTDGTTGTVTLSQTSANFVFIEIFFRDDNNGGVVQSVRCASPNGAKAQMQILSQDETDIRHNVQRATISGTSITKTLGQVNYMGGGRYTVNEIKIIKVVGWK